MKIKTLSYLLIPVLGLAASVSLAAPNPNTTGTMTMTFTNNTACPYTFRTPDAAGGNKCTMNIIGNTIYQTETVHIKCLPGASLDLFYNQAAELIFSHVLQKGFSTYSIDVTPSDNHLYNLNGEPFTGGTSDEPQDTNLIKKPNFKVTVRGGTSSCK